MAWPGVTPETKAASSEFTMSLLPIHNVLSKAFFRFRAGPNDILPPPSSPSMTFIAAPSFFTQSARTALPLTTPTTMPLSDTLRRRLKPTTLPSQDTPSQLPPPHNFPRPIKVLCMAAVEESQTRRMPSILTGASGTIFAIALHLIVAMVFLSISEGWALLDALYFAVVIATTVGYGDITPVKAVSKIFVSLYAIVSVAIIANMLQSLVERFADAQRDIASSAQKALLGPVKSSPSDTASSSLAQNAAQGDILAATKIAVSNARRRLRSTILMLAGACISGAVLYRIFLQVSIIDVFYFLCVSMTTVGLGDIHPVTRIGKAYAAIWLIFTSLGFANILSQVTDVKVKEKEHETASAIFSSSFGEKMFKEIDGDNDGTLSEAEYLGYIICKLGKVTPNEVRNIIARFRVLDRDGSGVITKEEVDFSLKKTS